MTNLMSRVFFINSETTLMIHSPITSMDLITETWVLPFKDRAHLHTHTPFIKGITLITFWLKCLYLIKFYTCQRNISLSQSAMFFIYVWCCAPGTFGGQKLEEKGSSCLLPVIYSFKVICHTRFLIYQFTSVYLALNILVVIFANSENMLDFFQHPILLVSVLVTLDDRLGAKMQWGRLWGFFSSFPLISIPRTALHLGLPHTPLPLTLPSHTHQMSPDV